MIQETSETERQREREKERRKREGAWVPDRGDRPTLGSFSFRPVLLPQAG